MESAHTYTSSHNPIGKLYYSVAGSQQIGMWSTVGVVSVAIAIGGGFTVSQQA